LVHLSAHAFAEYGINAAIRGMDLTGVRIIAATNGYDKQNCNNCNN
jgi:hypothetical protein